MPSLHLTWSSPNHCFVKSLGHWFNETGKKRVPRFFRFHHPNTPEGLVAAQTELLPLVAQWKAIKADAKKRGEKYPVWYRENLPELPVKNFMFLSTISKPDESDDDSTRDNLRRAELRRVELLKQDAILKANAAANPNKPLVKASIQDARDRYCESYELSGVKGRTAKGIKDQLKAVLGSMDLSQPMMRFNAVARVDELIAEVSRRELRGRSAHNYARAIKGLCEWFAKQTKEYPLPDDWKEMFVKRRFRNPPDLDAVFSEDAEEHDFEIYSNADIKEVLAACTTDRQKLYVLLALNAAMYYVGHCFRSQDKKCSLGCGETIPALPARKGIASPGPDHPESVAVARDGEVVAPGNECRHRLSVRAVVGERHADG